MMEVFEPNRADTQYCLSVSYGKDSLACIGACEKLGWRIDRIIHAEIWATQDIPADLPPMVEFKKKADAIIKERYGIDVEHYCAVQKIPFVKALPVGGQTGCHTTMHSIKSSTTRCTEKNTEDFQKHSGPGALNISSSQQSTWQKKTYQDVFYKIRHGKSHDGEMYGFPIRLGNWCTSLLKTEAIERSKKQLSCLRTLKIQSALLA